MDTSLFCATKDKVIEFKFDKDATRPQITAPCRSVFELELTNQPYLWSKHPFVGCSQYLVEHLHFEERYLDFLCSSVTNTRKNASHHIHNRLG